jgi:hypothetical protein
MNQAFMVYFFCACTLGERVVDKSKFLLVDIFQLLAADKKME